MTVSVDTKARSIAVLYIFTRKPRDGRHCGVAVEIERLRGTIDQREVKQTLANAGLDPSLQVGKWKDFKVLVLRVTESKGDRTYVKLTTLVPLEREAIQIKVFGDAADEREIRGINQDLLDNLDGPSNWATPEEHIADKFEHLGLLALSIGIPVVLILFGMRQSRARNRLLRERGELAPISH